MNSNKVSMENYSSTTVEETKQKSNQISSEKMKIAMPI